MRLDPLYTVTFTTPEAWSVEVASDAGIEGRGFLLAEGRSAGRLSARYRWLNNRVCTVEGEVRPRTDGSGFDIVLEVSEMVWEGLV
jgi:hypothetical protein